jgi:hypothetical protein
MIAESRSLIFTRDDVVAAVLSFARERPEFLPDGELLEVQIEGSAAPELCIRLQVPDRIFETTIRLSAEQLAAVMIHFCIAKRIPIPRRSRKEIRHAASGGIQLLIAMDRPAARQPASGPLVIPFQAA